MTFNFSVSAFGTGSDADPGSANPPPAALKSIVLPSALAG